MTKLSIIIPVYKVEPYIERCLDSVMSQEWNSDATAIECILVDDCTPDQSMVKAQRMIADYQGPIQFISLKHEENRGLSAARNTGIRKATGDYLMFIDSDDHLMPDSLEHFIQAITDNPGAEVIIGKVYKEQTHETYLNKVKTTTLLNEKSEILNAFFQSAIFPEAWSKLIRRDLIVGKDILFIEGIMFEDVPWTYLLLNKAHQVLIIPFTTYVYKDNPTGIMASSKSEKKISRAIDSYTTVTHYLTNNPPAEDGLSSSVWVDYLLYIHMMLTRGLELVWMGKDDAHRQPFLQERSDYTRQVLRSKRVLLTCFCLLLYKPFFHLFKIKAIRRNYYYLQKIVSRLQHLTDWLH